MSLIDINGKVVFKVKLGNEIKKVVIHNDELTYNELCLMMQRIFSEKISKNDEFSMKYTDEDNDLITIANDNDVLLAIQTNKILRITIYLKNADSNNIDSLKQVNPNEIVKELQNIRNSIDKFLDKFEYILKVNNNININSSNAIDKKSDKPVANDSTKKSSSKFDDKNLNSIDSKLTNLNIIETHKEFDPLATNKKISRAETPDSVSSNTSINASSSPSQRKLNYMQEQQVQQLQQQQTMQHQQTLNAHETNSQNQLYNPVMNSFQASSSTSINLDSPMNASTQQLQQQLQQPVVGNVSAAALVPPPQTKQIQQQPMQPPTIIQPQQLSQQVPLQYQAQNMYQNYQNQQQQPTQIQGQYQAQIVQQQLTDQQQQYMLQQHQLMQQQQQLQNTNYQMQQQAAPAIQNPYAKATTGGGLNQSRYPTPTTFTPTYK